VRTPDRRNDFIRRPAAAECFIERHETVASKPEGLGPLLLQGELLPFRVQHVEEVGQATIVTLGRHLGGLARRVKRKVEAAQTLPKGLVAAVSLVSLLYRNQYILLVCGREFMRPVVGDLDLGVERAEVEDRGIEGRAHRSDPG